VFEHGRAVMEMFVEPDRGIAARQRLGETLLALFERLRSGLQGHVTFLATFFIRL
jgi:hypothetical protein